MIDVQGDKPKTMSIKELRSENSCFAKTCGGNIPPYLVSSFSTSPRNLCKQIGVYQVAAVFTFRNY